MSAMSDLDIEVRALIKEIRTLQSDSAHWSEQNEDDEDKKWFGLVEFDQQIAGAGIRLADVMEKLMGGM